jgi:hypothetical protein
MDFAPLRASPLIFALYLAAASVAFAQSSADYSIVADTCDSGGQLATSPAYAAGGSVCIVAGTSGMASPAEIAKSGYIGQLYNVTALQINAPSATVNVGQTLQLGATGFLDDNTAVALDPGTISWSVQSGPIAGIATGGLLTPAVVYQDSPAVVTGDLVGFTGSLELTVVNAAFDAWQVAYFGANNPLAAPGTDADGTGQSNLFKYIAGLSPVDPASRFIVSVASASGASGQMSVTFSPLIAGINNNVQYCTDLLSADWQILTGGLQSTTGDSATVIDPTPSAPQRFYRVQISN